MSYYEYPFLDSSYRRFKYAFAYGPRIYEPTPAPPETKNEFPTVCVTVVKDLGGKELGVVYEENSMWRALLVEQGTIRDEHDRNLDYPKQQSFEKYEEAVNFIVAASGNAPPPADYAKCMKTKDL